MAIINRIVSNDIIDDDFMISDSNDQETIICKSPDKVKQLVKALSEDKIIHFISKGDWSMHDLIIELLNNYYPAELYFTTYALRELSVRQLLQALEKKRLLAVHILIDTKARSRTPDVIQLAEMNLNRVYLTSIHAKVAILKTADSIISINGSANWTTNPRIEAGTISTNKSVGEFHINWMEKIMKDAQIFE